MSRAILDDAQMEHVRSLVRRAGALARSSARTRATLSVSLKGGPADPVSSCDLEVEAMLREGLAEAFPHDRFWGEEIGMPEGPERGRVWICDPIDGTRSFLRFGRNYCISLGLLLDGAAVAGFIHDPEADDLYEAVLGGGARLNGEPLAQPDLPDMRHAIVGIGVSDRVAVDAHVAFVAHVLEAGALTHQHGSGALALAQTAAGRLDGYVELHMNAWDALPGLLIAREAGARCIDWPHDALRRGGIVAAANPGIAADIIGFIEKQTSSNAETTDTRPAEPAETS